MYANIAGQQVEEYLGRIGFKQLQHQPGFQWPLLLREAMHVRLLALENSGSTVILADPQTIRQPAVLTVESSKQGRTSEVPKESTKRRRREETASTPGGSHASLSPNTKLSKTPRAGEQIALISVKRTINSMLIAECCTLETLPDLHVLPRQEFSSCLILQRSQHGHL